LREDVVEAVRDGKLTVYAVKSVEEGIEILTGVPAGEPDSEGAYPEGTVNYRIVQNLEHLAAKAREHMGRGYDRDGASSDGGSGGDDAPSF